MQRIQWIGRFGLMGGLALAATSCGGGDEVPIQRPAPPAAELEAGSEEDWEENTIPVIEWVRLEPDAPAAGASVTAQVRVNDADGDELELGYAWKLNGRPARSSTETLSLGSAMKGDTVELTVTASDGWDESDPKTITASVGNTPPVLQSIAFDPLGTIHRGQNVSARPVASDADGDVLDFEYTWWVNDRELNGRSDQLDTSTLRRGDQVRVQVVATDGYAKSNSIKSEPIAVENSPPKFVSSPKNTGVDGSYLYQVEAKDPDGDRRLRFRLEQAPAGMTIDPVSGELSWTPPADATGTHTVEVIVDDLQGGVASQRFTVVMEAAAEAEAAAGDAPAADAAPAAPAAPAP